MRKLWTDEEEEALKKLWTNPSISDEQIDAVLLKRTWGGIRKKALQLGFTPRWKLREKRINRELFKKLLEVEEI